MAATKIELWIDAELLAEFVVQTEAGEEVALRAEQVDGDPDDLGFEILKRDEPGAVALMMAARSAETVLVHLNVALPGGGFTAEDVAREIKGALEVGTDLAHTPALAVSKVEVVLAEEV